MEVMYEIKNGVQLASERGRWVRRFNMDAAKGVSPDACRNLALFVAQEMHPKLQIEVRYSYCFSGGVVAFFIDIYLT